MEPHGEAKYWKVVGGTEKGGIVVREGKELASREASSRLTTGALVRQVELVGERVRYQRVHGDGPEIGWISRRLKDKHLLVPADAPRKLRVLCLHGTAGSPTVLKSQLRPLLSKSDMDMEFLFHAGHLECGEDDEIIGKQVQLMKRFFPPPFMQYAIPKGGCSGTDGLREDPSTWRIYDGLDECLERAQAFIEQEAPIDAILGFSQGSNIANILVAQASHGQGAEVQCVVHMCTSLPGWTLQLPHFFEQPLSTPALIVRGEKDTVASGSEDVAGLYVEQTRQLKIHSDGHKPFPAKLAEAEALVEDIRAFLLKHCRI